METHDLQEEKRERATELRHSETHRQETARERAEEPHADLFAEKARALVTEERLHDENRQESLRMRAEEQADES